MRFQTWRRSLAALLPSLHINGLSGKKEQKSRAWRRRGTDPGLNTDLWRGIRGHASVRSRASVLPPGPGATLRDTDAWTRSPQTSENTWRDGESLQRRGI